jgi:hypothetical protein
VGLPSIIESRATKEGNAHRTSHATNATKKMVVPQRVRGKTHGHEVFQLDDPIRKQEARYQSVRRRPIKLLVPHVSADRGYLESPALYVVQQRSEDAGRIKVWVTVPVDGTVHAHKGYRAHVADDADFSMGWYDIAVSSVKG